MKTKSDLIAHSEELATAFQNYEIQKISQLLSIMDVADVNQTFIPDLYDDTSLGDVTRYLTPIQFVIKKGYLDLLKILLEIDGIEINMIRDYIPPLFLAIELDRFDMISLLLKNPRVNVNGVFRCIYSKNCTPLMYAYYLNKPHIFYQLLQCSSINIHSFIECDQHALSLINIKDGRDKTEFVMYLIDNYCYLFISQPDEIRDLLLRHPKLVNLLANYRSELWRSLNKQVHNIEPKKYYSLLKNIVDSEHQEKTVQSPFYIVLSVKNVPFWFSMFYDDPLDELKQIKEKVRSVSEHTCKGSI